MPKILGELQSATFENLSSDPSGSVSGRVWNNTTESRVKSDDGSLKRAILKNDQFCTIGNNGTANNNIRLHRGAAEVLQHVKGGDATAEGSLSTSLAQVSGRTENYTDASKPAAGNAGRVIWLTDLQRFIGDNGTTWQALQGFDFLAPTTTKGDLIVHDASVNVRLPVGTNGTFLKADSAASTGVAWASAAGTLSYRSVTTTDSPTNTDDVLSCSGSSFTITMFTAVGNTGKVIRILHNGADIAKIYSVTGTGGQTIGGLSTYTLGKPGQALSLFSDGSNWLRLEESGANGVVATGLFPQTAAVTWSRTNTVLGAFTADADAPGPTVETNYGPGTLQTTDANLPRFTVNDLPAGEYEVTVDASVDNSAGGVENIAINDGTDTRGTIKHPAQGTGQALVFHCSAAFKYTHAGVANKTFEVFGAISTGAVSISLVSGSLNFQVRKMN